MSQKKFVYVLSLAQGKYYVGVTTNINSRMRNHANGEGSRWTRIYKPRAIIHSHEEQDKYDEINTTIAYMNLYGIENVRGGPWVTDTVTLNMVYHDGIIERSANNRCMRCGRNNHYAKACYSTRAVDKYGIIDL
jgi:predicted GIY-YIG superfamily endonuclease